LSLGAVACGDARVTVPRTRGKIAITSGNAQQGVPGAPLDRPIIIVVRDASGAPVADVRVSWLADDGGTIDPGQTVTDENGGRWIRITRQQPFYSIGIRSDSRRAAQELPDAGSHLSERRIAEERSCQQDMMPVLDQQPGNAEVRDSNQAVEVTAICGRTADHARSGLNLRCDRKRSTTRDQ